jgi:hypothetical protein
MYRFICHSDIVFYRFQKHRIIKGNHSKITEANCTKIWELSANQNSIDNQHVSWHVTVCKTLQPKKQVRRKKLALLSSSSTPYNKLTDPNGIPTRQIALVRQTIGN